ncbi:MAG: hypothetical protein ACRDQ5_14785, partial [Sciscionella sp.]
VEPISDQQVVGVLRPFVTVAAPLVDALREADPFGLRQRLIDRPAGEGTDMSGASQTARDRLLDMFAGVHMPGTAAWAEMDVAARTGWWVGRVGRFVALLASIPGIGGALADRLPVTDALGTAGQGLLLCAIAGEHGITDTPTRVRLLASVLFDRTVSAELAAGAQPAERERVAELGEDIDASRRSGGRVTLRAMASTVWKLGKALRSLSDELDKRPRGRFYHKALGKLPVVGMLGDYLGERSGLERAAKAGTNWIHALPVDKGSGTES